MKKYRFVLTAIMVIMTVAICNAQTANPITSTPSEQATGVILLIGDGMGPEVVGLARDYARLVEERELWIEKVAADGHLALAHTRALGSLVTDSAAAGTALATGEKTLNTRISVDSSGNLLTTILELAKKDSRSTGLVSTTRLTHATPACFAAHILHRDSENEIAEQMLASGADVMLGGGLRHWIPQDEAASAVAGFPGKSKRKDAMNLLKKAEEDGYRIATNRENMLAVGNAKKLLGLFAASHLPYALDRRPDDGGDVPSLAEMTKAALKILSKNEKGFFLMVEGGRIDHAAHTNDVATMLADMMDFDEAVGVAYTFAKKQGRTAVFVTADHATGASCLSARYSDEAGRTIYPDEATIRKIARQDASFENILRSLERDWSAAKLKEVVLRHTGIEISDDDAAFILKMEPLSPFHVIKPQYRRIGGYATLALGRVLGVEYGTTWATAEHFASPVMLAGYGPGTDIVHGFVENNEVSDMMKKAGGL